MINNIFSLFYPPISGEDIVFHTASLLDVKITKTAIRKTLEEHPDFPSLLSISDTLSFFGIENLSVKIDPIKIAGISTPFIAQIKDETSDKEEFTIVRHFSGNSLTIWNAKEQKWIEISAIDFTGLATGIALLFEARKNAGEKNYIEERLKELRKRNLIFLMAITLPVLILLASIQAIKLDGAGALLPVLFAFLSLAGGIICFFLLLYEIDEYNPLIRQICGANSTKVKCGAVLQSKNAKIRGVSWSIIGFSYFIGSLLAQLNYGLTAQSNLSILSWASSLASLFIIYSIYFQWKIAKQWCTLCLSVQAILFCQFVVSRTFDLRIIHLVNFLSGPQIIITLTYFLLPFMAVSLLMPALLKAKEKRDVQIQLQRLKHDPLIFGALLRKERKINAIPIGLGITLGNQSGGHKLIKVCNPYCGPCAMAHKPIEELLDLNDDLELQIVFTASNQENDFMAPPVKHLLAIAEKNDQVITRSALDDWYLSEEKDYDLFASNYPMNGELKKQDAKITDMSKWCEAERITYTPTLFIALPGDDPDAAPEYYELPDPYSVRDLKYFLS